MDEKDVQRIVQEELGKYFKFDYCMKCMEHSYLFKLEGGRFRCLNCGAQYVKKMVLVEEESPNKRDI